MKIFTADRCRQHVAPYGFPERPERLQAVVAGLEAESFEIRRAGDHPGIDEEVVAVHGDRYPQRFRRAVERGEGLFGSADTPVAEGTWEAARAAVAATLEALDWVMAGEGRRAFAAVRPPGHHAERELAMGFCYFNNIAVAASRARTAHGLSRVSIVDIDVHHGNGTQHLFEEDPQVQYASAHQFPFYPGSGAASEVGIGAGRGATLNVPLPAGTGDDGYERALLEVVLPEVESHAPDLLLVSAGFDAWRQDPLGGMSVSAAAFERWGRWLGELADRTCTGRVVAVLEGGYDLAMLPELAGRFVTGLAVATSTPRSD